MINSLMTRLRRKLLEKSHVLEKRQRRGRSCDDTAVFERQLREEVRRYEQDLRELAKS